MKKIKTFLIIISLFIFLPLVVNAEENSVKINAPTTISKGTDLSVDVVLSSDVAVDGFKATFTYESNVLEVLNYEFKDNWKQTGTFSTNSPVSFDFLHENGITGNTTVITIKFRVKDDVAKTNTSLTIEGTSKSKEDGTVHPLAKNTVNIDIKSRDNTIKSLKFNGTSINNFMPNEYTYKESVDQTVTTINFDVELNDKTATYKEGYEPKTNASLDYGENVFEIIVVSATKEERKYTVTIVREDNRGTDNYLDKLIVNSNPKLTEKFTKNSLEFSITTHKLKKIDIEAIPHDSKATVKIEPEDKELIIGENIIKITVISEKNEERVYTLRVNNTDNDIDTSLKNIELFGCDEELNFEKGVLDYEILYKAKYRESLVIKPEVNNPKEAEVSIDKDITKLKPGDTVTITVSALDGTKNVESYYTITFKKDTRLNFFLLLGIIIFIVLLVIFINLYFKNKKQKKEIEIKEEELQKTKRLEKIIRE